MSSWRNYILKALLGALALTAVAGTVGVMSSRDVMWRLCGTCFAAAVACLLMLRVSSMLDQPATRSAGLAGAIGITAEFILFVIMIWGLGYPRRGAQEEIFGTVSIIAVATVASMGFLKMLGSPATRIAAATGLAITAAAGATAMIAAWWPRGSWTGYAHWRVAENLWGTSITTGGLGVLAVAALVGVGAERRHWRWAGVAAAVVALIVAEIGIWGRSSRNQDLLATLIALAAWVALAIPLLRLELPAQHRWLRLATLVAGAATAGLWVFVVLGDFESEALGRAAAACTIPTACGALALAIITKLKRRVETADLPRDLRSITLYCPRCTRKQTRALGAAACAACGLRIEVRAEQPACGQCGYLIYGTSVTRCPECGTPVTRPAQAA